MPAEIQPDKPARPAYTSPALEALKVVIRLRHAREAALAAFIAADRALYDAEQEMQAIRLMSPRRKSRYSH